MTADDTPAGFMVEQRQPHTDSVMGESSTTEPPLLALGQVTRGSPRPARRVCWRRWRPPEAALALRDWRSVQAAGVDRAPGQGAVAAVTASHSGEIAQSHRIGQRLCSFAAPSPCCDRCGR